MSILSEINGSLCAIRNMPTVTDNLKDAADRHTVYLLRWSRGTYRKHLNLIDKAIADMTYRLSVRAPEDGTLTAIRLQSMIDEAKKISTELYSALSAAVNEDYRELGEYEARFQVAAVQAAYPIELALTTIPAAQIHSAAMAQPFRGKILRDWWKSQNASTREAFQAAIRIGYVEGESLGQIAARLRGVGEKSKREIEAIIRTATNHYAQQARNKVTQANAEIFANEIWVATLDGRTSPICRGLDGKEFPIGQGKQPPAHFNCRSQRIPKTKSWEELGFDGLDEDAPLSRRPFVADSRRVKDIPKPLRDSVIGTTTERSYNDWLKTQPRDFVEEVLGKSKAKLYLDGGLPLDKFVNREGRELTLAEIDAKESKVFADAWKKAFA